MPMSVGRRPKRSDGIEPASAPSTVPHRAAEMASPCIASLIDQTRCTACSAPEMTAVSKPNRKPASAAVMDHSQTMFLRAIGVPSLPLRC